ncbi:hypothetical protein SeLEV6574_g01325 [Synchytrium endobioticum]|uniref:C2H2-type domain-containing protein n=1 Tax=Synchytrium endobioticum TaxID=286115 RepID=A0A507DEM9_9FUNG|nr:hypothetical protein SeLEV6574_g01325 [Synchytrium endobioticum]
MESPRSLYAPPKSPVNGSGPLPSAPPSPLHGATHRMSVAPEYRPATPVAARNVLPTPQITPNATSNNLRSSPRRTPNHWAGTAANVDINRHSPTSESSQDGCNITLDINLVLIKSPPKRRHDSGPSSTPIFSADQEAPFPSTQPPFNHISRATIAPDALPFYHLFYPALEEAAVQVASRFPEFASSGKVTPELIQAYAEAAANAIEHLSFPPAPCSPSSSDDGHDEAFGNRDPVSDDSAIHLQSGLPNSTHIFHRSNHSPSSSLYPYYYTPALAFLAHHERPDTISPHDHYRRSSSSQQTEQGEIMNSPSVLNSNQSPSTSAQFRRRRRHKGTRFTMQPRKVKKLPHISITQADVALADQVNFLPDGKLPCPWPACSELFVRRYNLRVHYASHIRAQRRREIDIVSGLVDNDDDVHHSYQEEIHQIAGPQRRGRGRPRGSLSRRVYSYRVPLDNDGYRIHPLSQSSFLESGHSAESDRGDDNEEEHTYDNEKGYPRNVSTFANDDDKDLRGGLYHTSKSTRNRSIHYSGPHGAQQDEQRQGWNLLPTSSHCLNILSPLSVARSENSEALAPRQQLVSMESDISHASGSRRPRRNVFHRLWDQGSDDDLARYTSPHQESAYIKSEPEGDSDASNASSFSVGNSQARKAASTRRRRHRRARSSNTSVKSDSGATTPVRSPSGTRTVKQNPDGSPAWIDYPSSENVSEVVSSVNPDHSGSYTYR